MKDKIPKSVSVPIETYVIWSDSYIRIYGDFSIAIHRMKPPHVSDWTYWLDADKWLLSKDANIDMCDHLSGKNWITKEHLISFEKAFSYYHKLYLLLR